MERSMAVQIKHLAISSGNSVILRDFYTAVFGMSREERGQVVTDGYLGLNVNHRGQGRQAGIDHFGIEVQDVDEIMARCKEAYPKINFLKRPGNRPFASIGTHDPAGNVFDLSQSGMENRKGVYADALTEGKRPRHVSHFQLRAVEPEVLATFYHDVYGLERTDGEDGSYALTDGRVTLVIAPWNILNYRDTGVERPAIDHIGFAVDDLNAFKRDLDQLMETRPELFPVISRKEDEAARRFELLRECSRGELELNDPDGVLLDVAQA
jgi:catechol 2,3-dioxygenase-like lactoylglutathione lyase family enzyme